jgi:hypothetical protein
MTAIISNSNNATVQKKYDLICENLSEFNTSLWDDLHYFITNNPGKLTEYYVNNYKHHAFTIDSFEYLLCQINRNRNTFHNIGPFIQKNNKWYCKSKTKYDLISIINYQQQEIDRLNNIVSLHNLSINNC